MRDTDELISIIDGYFGDIIERVVVDHGYDVDLNDEYYELLSYITRNLIRTWFRGKNPTLEEVEKKVRYIKNRYPRRLSMLLSYLISKYVRMRNRIYGIQRDRRDFW